MWITKDSNNKTIRVWKNKPRLYKKYVFKEDEEAFDIWMPEEGDDDNISFILNDSYANDFANLNWHEAMEI